MKPKLVMPGDQLSTSEELLPGDGTFEENGIIRATRLGTYVINEKHRTAEVKPLTSIPVVLKKGDIVIARVTNAKEKMIIAEVKHVAGNNRSISSDTDATIYVKEIAQGFIKEASTEYKSEDYIRAKVIQVKPSLQLETKERGFGAIKALCSKCRHSLVKKSHGLECEYCGNKEYRRIADDYGTLDFHRL
jgi:exosome complex component CSL4